MRKPDSPLPYDGEWQKVVATGTYTETSPFDLGVTPSTVIKTVLGHEIKEGIYIGFQGTGQFRENSTLEPVSRLGGVFISKFGPGFAGRIGGGIETDFPTPPTYFEQQATDIKEDFKIPFHTRTILRVPFGTNAIAFTVGDSLYGDNVTLPNFGVHLSLPNGTSFIDTDGRGIKDSPGQFTRTPFDGYPGSISWSQLRGWYNEGTTNNFSWQPKRSLWMGRPERPHRGIDIFCPRGTTLTAPTDGEYIWRPNYHETLGNVAHFRFSHQGQTLSLAYAHCESSLHPTNRTIRKGQPAALSGCTGVPSSVRCGVDLPNGGLTDHVHLIFARDKDLVAETYDNPQNLLGWMLAE